MYITSVDGTIIDMRAPHYVRMGDNGAWQHCDEAFAEALSVNGTLYSLPGKEPAMREVGTENEDGTLTLTAAEAPVAIVSEAPDGTFTMDLLQKTQGHAVQIADIEHGLCEGVEMTEERLAGIEQALCELAAANV